MRETSEDRRPARGRGTPWRARRAPGLAGFVLLAAGLCAAACRREPAGPALEILVPFVPATLDPFADSRLVSRSLFTAVYEPLVQETAFGTRPAIAESWTNPAPDTWTFRIASGAAFHDGEPVTTADVVRAVQSARASRASITGFADVKSIEVRDERTLRFRTFRPAEDFLLAVSALFVPGRRGDSWVGTGPFRVVAHTPDRVLLRRHHRPTRPDPLLEEVVFRRFSSTADGIRLLRREVVAAVVDPTPGMVDEVRGNPRYRVVTAGSGGLTYLAVGFSAGAGPLEDVRVRRALRLSIDYPELTRSGTLDGGTPAGQVVPPGTFGFDPKRTAPRRDLSEARRLLALAGHPDGFDAVLDVNRNGRRAGEALACQVAEAGIRLSVVVHAPEEFAARIDGGSPLYIYSWFLGADAGHALRNAFHTKNAARGLGTLNRTGYSREAVDRAFEELAAATRPDERLAKLRAISALLDADLPWIPLFSAREARILPAWLDLPSRPDGLFVVAEARPAAAK